MSAGFNTDLILGEQTLHVQTEDRGPTRPVIDTTVYQNGHLLYRRSSIYEFVAAPDGAEVNASRERAEKQHRAIIEELRTGALDTEITTAIEKAKQAGGIQLQLLNPTSWLSSGNVSLEVAVVRRADGQPLAGAQVEAKIEGAAGDSQHIATSDERGRAPIRFPMPPVGKGELALVIRAKSDSGDEEIRFAMRSKTPPGGTGKAT